MIKKEIAVQVIESMWQSTLDNSKKKNNRGAPIAAVIFDVNNGEILCSVTNSRTGNQMTDFGTHAERICLEKYPINHNGKIAMFVTLNPCPTCIKLIRKNGKIKDVYYIIDGPYPPHDPAHKINIIKYIGQDNLQMQLIRNFEDNHGDWLEHKDKNRHKSKLCSEMEEEIKRNWK